MDKHGIYCIENIINEKKYIGQTLNLEKRKIKHFNDLRKNKNSNPYLQFSFNKYGINNFKFEILLYCESFELTRYEQFFVDFYTPETLYNIRLECVDSNLGWSPSSETRKKMSESAKNKIVSEETREKLKRIRGGTKNAMYGKHHSEKSKDQIRKNRKGKTSGKNNPNYRKGFFGNDNPMYGKHHSEESKRKISESCRGKNIGRIPWNKGITISKKEKHEDLETNLG
jgi:group I intron endonuclease